MPLVSIGRVEWRLTDATKESLASESRREAVKNAVVKARDYADVLGKGEPEVVEVSDESGIFRQGLRELASHHSTNGRGQGAGEILDFEPESVQLNTTVTVKFLSN